MSKYFPLYTQVCIHPSRQYGFIANARITDKGIEYLIVTTMDQVILIQRELIVINLISDPVKRQSERGKFVSAILTVNSWEHNLIQVEAAGFVMTLCFDYIGQVFSGAPFEADPYLVLRTREQEEHWKVGRSFSINDLTEEEFQKNCEYADLWQGYGIRHGESADNCGVPTRGYGELDESGYWEFTLKPKSSYEKDYELQAADVEFTWQQESKQTGPYKIEFAKKREPNSNVIQVGSFELLKIKED